MTQGELNGVPTFQDEHPPIGDVADGGTVERHDVWNRIQSSIKARLGVERFGIWFKKTELLDLSDSALVVGVPNVIIKQYLEQKYKDSVREIAKRLTGKDYEVRFDIASNLLRRSRLERTSLEEDGETETGDGGDAGRPLHRAVNATPASAARRPARRHCFERLVVTDSNRLPFLAAQELACRKNPRVDFLLIHGQPGHGKTALLEAIAAAAQSSGVASRSIYEMAETWCNDYYYSIQKRKTHGFRNHYRNCDLFLLDGIQFLQGKAGAQDEFLFTLKTLRSSGARVALSCSHHPNVLEEIKPEIQSLLKGAFWVELVMPPKDERIPMVQQLAELHSAKISPEVCVYLAGTFAAGIQELNASVSTVATYAALHGRVNIDMDTAYEALAASGRTIPRTVSLEGICSRTAAAAGITLEDLRGTSRSRNTSRARHMAVLLARRLTELSLTDIGRFLGGRSHSTVNHSLQKAAELEKGNAPFADMLEKIRKNLGN